MSMYRQLLFAIAATLILALVSSVVTSTLNTRTYLVEQLRVKNQDNASSLALSLSQIVEDPVQVELAVAAQFDSGNYARVQFNDVYGKVVLEKHGKDDVSGVPQWFTRLFPIIVPEGRAKVSKGWTQLGEVVLESHSTYAYKALWKASYEMALEMLALAAIAGYLGSLVIRRIKAPLDKVVEQAQAIMHKRFITIEVPKVLELKSLAGAMNSMVEKLRQIFDEEAHRLELLKKEANYDQLTGIANRQFFMAKLQEAISSEEGLSGYCLILRLLELGELNKRLGRRKTDALIKAIANKLDSFAEASQSSCVGRLNGSDFGILLPTDHPESASKELLKLIGDELSLHDEHANGVAIGLAPFSKGVKFGDLLSQVDLALASAETQGKNTIKIAETKSTQNLPATLEDWSNLIKSAIAYSRIYLLSFPVVDFSGKLIHHEGPMRIREGDDAEWIPAGKFLSVAERIGLNDQLDLAAVEIGLNKIREDKKIAGYAINLSPLSLKRSGFVSALAHLIGLYPKEAGKLWLEIPESGLTKSFDELKALINLLKKSGVRFGIEHFGQAIDQMTILHDMGIDFLKVDASFVRNLDSHAGNQSFLKGLVSISHEMGMQVIAEGVSSEAESKALKAMGFDGLTGPVVKSPN